MRKSFLFVSLCLTLLPIHLYAAPSSEETDYMAILIDGHKIGHSIHTRIVEGSRVTTSDAMNLLIGRGPTAIRYTGKEISVETLQGKPISFEMSQNISGKEDIFKGIIAVDKVKMTIQNGDTKTQKVIPYPNGSLMAEGLRLLQIQKGLKAGQKYETFIFRPDMETAVQAQVQVGAKNKVDLLGRIIELTEVRVIMLISSQAIEMTTYVDDDFRALKNIVPMMGMKLEMINCEKDFALSEDDIVDFLDKLCVQSPSPITKNQLSLPLVYEITSTADRPLNFPVTDTQTVKEIAPGRFQITIQPAYLQGTAKVPYNGKDPLLLKSLESTQYLQTKDSKILDLVKYAVTTPDDAVKVASQIESFVKGYITTKDLSVGYASAAEVARVRQGDCSEHAVLAAAMCRAAGIPARVVCGVVYADAIGNKKNVFGGHMWAEVNINNKWVPIDPTRAPNGYSSGHIALALGDGNPSDFFSMVNTMGCFKIEKVTPTPSPQIPAQ